MKNMIFVSVVSMLMLTLITSVTGCDKKDFLNVDQVSIDDLALRGAPNSDSCFLLNPSPTVNETEIEMLKYMREEEKLAHDVYVYFFNLYNVPVFKNISRSEQRHMDRIKCLLDNYEIADPIIDEEGKFTNVAIQDLYNALTEQGSQSLSDAYMVGATIEDLDIKDLATDLGHTENPAIIDIFEKLMCGSRNHLRSYYSLITNGGGTYAAQFISTEDLTSIVTTAREFCGNGQGTGCNNQEKGSKGKGRKGGKNNGTCDNTGNAGNMGGKGNNGTCGNTGGGNRRGSGALVNPIDSTNINGGTGNTGKGGNQNGNNGNNGGSGGNGGGNGGGGGN